MKRLCSLLLCLTVSHAAMAAVLPPDGIVEDKTIGEWSAEWWLWALSISTNQHPLLDPDGSYAHVGQPDSSVFFLAGVISISGTATRQFSMPEGKYLFFPLINVYSDNVFVDPILSVEELREQNAGFISVVTELHASIDGSPIPDLWSYRALSPVFGFDFTFPDNLETVTVGEPFVGLDYPIVSDGFYLMVEPLPRGEHVINFGGTFGSPINFTLDITDTITVVAAPLWELEQLAREFEETAVLPTARMYALNVSLEAAQASFEREQWKAGINQLRAFQHKVRAQVAERDAELAEELWNKAESIIERAEGEGR